MDFTRGSRQKNVWDMIFIVKILSLLFCGIIVCSQFFMKNKYINSTDLKNYNMGTFGFMVCVTLAIFCLWILILKNMDKWKGKKVFVTIEDICFMIIFSAIVLKTQPYSDQYNFIFLFIIIISTIQSGKKYGMTLAFMSSVIIFLVDILSKKSPLDANTYFESDMILSSIFMVISWIIGHYVEIENRNIREKNIQLSKLNSKLNKQKEHRRNIEKILLKNEKCYNLLIDNSNEVIFIHDFNRIIFGNESAAKIVGLSMPDDLGGRSIFEFIPKDEREAIRKKFSRLYREHEITLVFDQKIVNKDSTVSLVENSSTYIMYDGRPAILTIIHDITPEEEVKKLKHDVEENVKLLNESREFNKLITQFFTNISHELKTPLNVIFSAIQMLSIYNSESRNDKMEKYITVVKHNCYRLMKLINNLLDVTKLDSGFLKLGLKNYDIVSVIEEISLSVGPYLKAKNMSITFDTNVEEKIMAFDLEKLQRIILNIISNAVKFTNKGGSIFINLTDKKDVMCISIRDTGIGIPKDKLDVIFERFGQVDKTLNRNCEGSGMGLYLVKSFVNMHGGKIHVKSKVGIGTEFIIELPVVISDESDVSGRTLCEDNIEKVSIEFSDIYYDTAVN